MTLDSLIGRLIAFELSNFDNYSPTSVEFAFKTKLTLDRSNKKKKIKYMESDSESDDDLDELEALLAKRLPRGKGKYKGKLPIICFTCKKVGHITEEGERIDKIKVTKTIKIKVGNPITLLKKMVLIVILMIMMKKLFMLQ
jgi:hypothetical protein